MKITKYYVDAERLWRMYVPESGQADTVQGELLRATEKLRNEAQRNGNGNWDEGHEILCSFIRNRLCTLGCFNQDIVSQLQSDLDRLQDYEHPYLNDDLYDRITDRVVEWCQMNPMPIPNDYNPDLRR